MDFNYTYSLLHGPDDFSTSLLGLSDGAVGEDVQKILISHETSFIDLNKTHLVLEMALLS